MLYRLRYWIKECWPEWAAGLRMHVMAERGLNTSQAPVLQLQQGGGMWQMDVAELRARAASKRRSADLARRTAPGLMLAYDRAMMLELSQELDAEAAGLEARADELAPPPSKSD